MIRLIITGGTIDKQYNELNGELHFSNSQLPEMLSQARCTLPLITEQLMLKDSLEMNPSDRQIVANACLQADEDKIIIAHGTDTMVKTAQQLTKAVPDKTIVLFGAMIPYRFGYSDALFNLGCALSSVQLLESGVFIAMNGQVFKGDNVQKLTQLGQFDVL